MRRLLVLALPAAWLLTIAPGPPPAPTPIATPPPSHTPSPTPVPTPTPTPSLGQLSISPTLGAPGTKITVQGTQFGPNEAVKLYWDTADKSLGTVQADGQGGFKLDVEVPAADPGGHQVCAVETGVTPCASFRLEAATPTPSPTPSAAPSVSPPAVATPTPVPLPSVTAPATQNVSAVSVLLQPPFVFFPLLLVLAALGGCGLWIWSGLRASNPPRRSPSATVTHRSARLDAAPSAQPRFADALPPLPPAYPPKPDPEPEPAPAIVGPRGAGGDDALDLPQPSD